MDTEQTPPAATPAAEDRFDIVINGGGFAGLTMACGLAKSAPGVFRIAVIERAPAPQLRDEAFDGRTIALMAAAKNMLDALGLWDRMAAGAEPVKTIDLTDTTLDMPVRSSLLHFDTLLSGDEPAAFIVENTVLRGALLDAAAELQGISIISPDTVAAADFSGAAAHVTLASGRRLSASLVIAADGRFSALSKMAGFKTLVMDSGQAGLVATVAHEKPHHGRAVQHFLPAGPFAILPMSGNRSSLVWTEKLADARAIMELGSDAVLAEIEKRMGGMFGRLSILGKLHCYPLTLTLARSFVKPRIVLIGDAAHGLHWIAGQGLNHGLKDVAALVEVLVDASRLGLDIGDLEVLSRYERWRRFDSTTSAAAMVMFNKLFSNDSAPLRMLRQFGLGVVDRVSPLKRFFVEEAAGVTGEVPKLMRGELV